MKRLTVLAVAALFALPLGCRSAHLSHDTGKAFREAFADQRERGDTEDPKAISLSANDAHGVLRAHYLGKSAGSSRSNSRSNSRSGGAGAPIILGGAAGGAGGGSDGGINLRAK